MVYHKTDSGFLLLLQALCYIMTVLDLTFFHQLMSRRIRSLSAIILQKGASIMKQSKFDLVMDYIDENINRDTETIKRGIIDLIGINSNTFGHFFSVLTGDKLGSYIRNRRLYYAAMELQNNSEKTIFDIALDYGYSDQSAFTRAFTTKYGFPPSDLRQKNVFYFLKNDKYRYEDFDTQKINSRSNYIWRQFERTGYLDGLNLDFIENVEESRKKFGFDVDTGYAIADLAERLDVPVFALMEACFNLVEETKSEPDYFSNRIMAAIDLGIRSDSDLQKMCDYYSCEYYELNSFLVKEYYKTHS